jgi:hypothetical protein
VPEVDLRAFDEIVLAAGAESGMVANGERRPSITAREIAATCGWLPEVA